MKNLRNKKGFQEGGAYTVVYMIEKKKIAI